MTSLTETIRLIAANRGKRLVEAPQPSMQANQPTVGMDGNAPVNTGPAGGTPQETDEAGTAVVQAELILIADRAQKIAVLAGQGGPIDPMLQTQITGIASDISQLYADLVMAAMPDPNDPNAQQGAPAPGGSQVNTNPKVAEEQLPNLESIEQLDEISNILAKNYIRKSFNQLGSENEIDPKVAKRRAAGMALATDKAGGVDALYGNKSMLGKKYGKAANPVRVPTREETDQEAQDSASTTRGRVKKSSTGTFIATNQSGNTKEFKDQESAHKHSMSEAVAPKPDGDNDADDENEHIIMQLHKSVTLGGKKIVKFASGQKVKVDPKTAHRALQKFNSMKPMEKAKAQEFLRQSHNNLQSFVKEDFSFDEDGSEELAERVIKSEPHFIDQLEGSVKTSNGKEIEFENGQKVTIPPTIAKKIVDKFQSSSAYDKQQLQKYVRSSYANLIRAARG